MLKGAVHDEMLRAIQVTAEGGAIFSSEIANRMMIFFAHIQTNNPQRLFPELSEREREVLTLMARGMSNMDIGQAMNISLKTVQNHVSNILNKLRVVDRTQAMSRAKNAGLF